MAVLSCSHVLRRLGAGIWGSRTGRTVWRLKVLGEDLRKSWDGPHSTAIRNITH